MFMSFCGSSFGTKDGLLPDAVQEYPFSPLPSCVLTYLQLCFVLEGNAGDFMEWLGHGGALIGQDRTHGVGRSHYSNPLTILRAVFFI